MIASIWLWLEPLLFFATWGLSFRKKNYSRIERDEFDDYCSKSYDELIQYIEQYGLDEKLFAVAGKELYLKRLKQKITSDRKFFTFIDGTLEKELLIMFNVPTELRFEKFLLNTYLHIKWKTYLKYSLFHEKFVRIFTKKKTVFHYLTIPGWLCRKHIELFEKVKEIKKPKHVWKEAYGYKKLLELAKKDENSSVKKVLDKVLTQGKITNQSIINIISSEKIILVHKYAEGFQTVRDKQDKKLKKLKSEITRLSKFKSKRLKDSRIQLENEKRNLINNWIRGPLAVTLEKNGFSHLFPKNDFTYFIPYSQLPEKYHSNYRVYIDDVIIKQAKEYLDRVKQNPFLDEFEGDLKYILIAELVQLSDLFVLTKERELAISAPKLNAMIISAYLEKGDKNVVNLYINDIVSNVDFKEQLDASTKSGNYVLNNFDNLKSILWSQHNIDIYKPIQLVTLTKNNTDDIVSELHRSDNSLQKHFIRNVLLKVIDFYIKLNQELSSIKE